MCCGVCLDLTENNIDVFGEKGNSDNICGLIAMHLQIQIQDRSQICEACWQRIRDFHIYYFKVKEKHRLNAFQLKAIDNTDMVLKTENWSETDYDKPFMDEQPTQPITFVAENETCNPDVQYEVHKSNKSAKKVKVRRQSEDEAGVKDFICDIEGCQKAFDRKLSLDVHKRSRHAVKKGSNKLTCSDCGKTFASKYSLSVHVNGVHKGAFARICEICAKTFKNKTIYLAHQKVFHSDEQPERIQCQICGNWLKDANSMRKHMNRHKDEETGPHICKHCGKKSPNKNALKCHIQHVHVKERVYKCSICDKAFKRQLNLKEHISVHTGEVLYTCNFCPKTFNSSANMYSHRKKAHKFELDAQKIPTK